MDNPISEIPALTCIRLQQNQRTTQSSSSFSLLIDHFKHLVEFTRIIVRFAKIYWRKGA